MSNLGEIAKYIRSKNAGPFWVTIDIFFDTDEEYERTVASATISEKVISQIYDVKEENVKIFYLPDLKVIKISYLRKNPQGSPDERDMHSGQQYIPLLDLELL